MTTQSWDEWWMATAIHYTGKSKDRSRRVAAIIVDDRQVQVSAGWNGFCRGVDDAVEERHQRPAKYLWTEHAERNAIYNAAACGHRTAGCRMYLPWYPCSDCARAIIQSGIREVIAYEPDWNDPSYAGDFAVTRTMLAEAGVIVRYMPGTAPVRKEDL